MTEVTGVAPSAQLETSTALNNLGLVRDSLKQRIDATNTNSFSNPSREQLDDLKVTADLVVNRLRSEIEAAGKQASQMHPYRGDTQSAIDQHTQVKHGEDNIPGTEGIGPKNFLGTEDVKAIVAHPEKIIPFIVNTVRPEARQEETQARQNEDQAYQAIRDQGGVMGVLAAARASSGALEFVAARDRENPIVVGTRGQTAHRYRYGGGTVSNLVTGHGESIRQEFMVMRAGRVEGAITLQDAQTLANSLLKNDPQQLDNLSGAFQKYLKHPDMQFFRDVVDDCRKLIQNGEAAKLLETHDKALKARFAAHQHTSNLDTLASVLRPSPASSRKS